MKAVQRPISKVFSFVLFSLVFLALNSCKEDRADMSGLLSTVPSSSAGVVAIDLKSLLQDAGCKVKDNEIKPGKELSTIISKMKDDEKKEILGFFNGESGISPECAVIFFDSNRMFLTLALADVAKFCESVEKEKQSSFADQGGGVKVCGNIAVKGAQAWICLSSGKRIDSDAIAAYSSLKTSQSFLSTDMAERFIEPKSDIIGWGHLNVLIDNFMYRNKYMLNMAAGFLFDDPSDLSFSVDFRDGEMSASAIILNDKGKPAKYLLQAEKVDLKTIESIGETCDALFAFTLTPKMVSKLEKAGSALGGALFGNMGDMLKNVDGTIAVAYSSLMTQGRQNMNGVITTKGDVSLQLKDLVTSMFGPVREDGKFLRFSSGTVTGALTVEECAGMLKGSCLGFVADLKGMENAAPLGEASSSFKSIALSLSPESGSLELKIVLKGNDPKENMILTILKYMV